MMKYKYHHNEASIYQDAIAMIEYMTQLITLPIQAHKVLEEVVAFRQSDAILQEKNLPKIHLMLEQYAEQFVWKVL